MEATAMGSGGPALSGFGRLFIAVRNGRAMAHPSHAAQPETVAYHGEVEPASSARLTAELDNGRFTVATDQPHVKVAWRVSGRRGASHLRHRQQEEV
jgi:hypothetical protein